MWLPRLPTDRIHRREAATLHDRVPSGEPCDAPLALGTKTAGAERITALDLLAGEAGLQLGMTVAEARAICPALRVLPHDTAADHRLLENIADWADRYTPMVGRDPPAGLMLDITGAAHLMGGEIALARDCSARLARQGLTAAIAIAPTAGAAWALVRAKGRGHIPETANSETLDTALRPLPVASLRLPPETVAALRRVGLRTIGDLIDRPRQPIAARFGPDVLRRLDQARGLIDEAIAPRQPVPPAVIAETLAEPILTASAVDAATRALAPRLTALLEERGQGATAVELAIFRVDGRVQRLALRFAEPTRDPKQIADLLALRLDHLDDPLDPGFGYDAMRLAATGVAVKTGEAISLSSLTGTADSEILRLRARLVDRLTARFGSEKVMALAAADTHLPERADRLVAMAKTNAQPVPKPQSQPRARVRIRPLRLLDPPESIDVMAEVPDGPPLNIRWRRRPLRILAADGPERIAPEWWQGWHQTPTAHPLALGASRGEARETRDYWRIEDDLGRRLWIYRLGFYGDPAVEPRWFVHGLFA